MTKMLKPLVEKETHDVLSIRIALNDITKDIFIWVAFLKEVNLISGIITTKSKFKKM